jgi:hypothetical protein
LAINPSPVADSTVEPLLASGHVDRTKPTMSGEIRDAVPTLKNYDNI